MSRKPAPALFRILVILITPGMFASCATVPHVKDPGYALIISEDTVWSGEVTVDGVVLVRKGATLTVLPGLEGSYPNFFFVVPAKEIESFAERFVAIRNRDDYERFVALYGVRRTNPGFWREADWFQARYATLEPREAGIFDLNRYRNR